MNRIESIYSLIDENDKVVDVGCDQAKLSIMLAKRNQKSIASDISEKVIDRASKTIKELSLNNLIDLRVSNGLDNIKESEVDTLVLSGMGTHTILDILSDTNIKFKKIITISNNYHDILRVKMNDLGYKINKELIIKENNKYYNLIEFTIGNNNLSREEELIGLNHIDKTMYSEYLNYLLNKYLNIQKQSKNQNKKINEIISIIKNRVHN